MGREQAGLEPQTLKQINEVLRPDFNPQQGLQFDELSVRWSGHFSLAQILRDDADKILISAREDVLYGQTQLAQVEQNLKATREFIYHPGFAFSHGRFSAMLGRVLVGLHIRKEHPWLAPISAEKSAVSAFLEQAKSNLEQAPVRIDREFTPQIRTADQERSKVEAELFGFCERIAVGTQDGGFAYARFVPFRSYALAETYAQTFHLNPQRVPNLADFTDQIAGYIRRRVKRDRTFKVLLRDPENMESRILTPLAIVSADRLPTPIKNRLKAWTNYHFLMGLYMAGIIAEPDLPEILREI